MTDNSKSTSRLIIELAKLRNRIYELEDITTEKTKLEKRVSNLEKQLENSKNTEKKLNVAIKEVLLNDIEEVIKILTKSEETNNNIPLRRAVEAINTSIAKIKKIDGN